MRSQTEMELKMFRLDESAYHAMRDAALKKWINRMLSLVYAVLINTYPQIIPNES